MSWAIGLLQAMWWLWIWTMTFDAATQGRWPHDLLASTNPKVLMRAPPPIDAHRAATSAYRQVICDGSVRPYPGAAGLVAELRQQYPAGCHSILVGLMPRASYGRGRGSPGQISIVLGLALPAVQDIDRAGPNGQDLQMLKKALAPNGRIGLAMLGGGVRQIVGPSTPFTWG